MAATQKKFSELLKELKEVDVQRPPQRLLVKSHIAAGPQRAGAKKPAPKRDLGLLLKSAINDAVASGRLSGTAAVRGLQALGLSEEG